jgi:FkbM family methyltransferase
MGDTTEHYLLKVPDFRKIYLYEPEITNYRYAETYLTSREPGSIGRIVLRNAGVGAGKEVMRMNVQGHLPGGCYVSNSGDYEVDIVSLDEDIEEPVNFIKMDIEGFELEALKGAARHIREKKPKLAICVYHKINDLWEIPFLIADLNPEYKLYLRRYHWMNENSETESVIYAV